jgi:hypothetical protein
MIIKTQKILKFSLVLAMVAAMLVFPLQVALAGLLNLSNTMSTVRQNVLSNHTIVFRTPTGVDASTDTITVTFPTGFAMGTFALLNFDLAVSAGGQTACPTGLAYTDRTLATTAGTGTWGVGQSGQVVTFTAPTDTAAGQIPTHACVQIEIGSNATFGGAGAMQITNPAAGSYTITIAGTFGDSGSIAVSIITDDRVAVTADVAAAITFAINDNTIGFGTLSATVARFADGTGAGSGTEVVAHNFTVSTNAASGYTVAISGATLTSGAHTITAIGPTAAASAPGTEQFGLRITATGGTGAAVAPYNTTSFALDTAAFPDEVAASPSASVTTTFDVRYLANISAATEAGTYTTNLTYTATGRF